jgi:hypothetical protein
MTANTSYYVPPRLVRPERGALPGPRVFSRRPEVPYTRQQARRRLAVIYSVVGLLLFAGWATGPRAAEAEPPPAVVEVGAHTFVEAEPGASTLVTAPGETRTAKISHYWPPQGGVNCATFVNGDCVSNMASGLPWWAWVGRAAACPEELPFWTTLTLPGGEIFVCLDRGSKVVTTAAGEIWLDLLLERAPVPYGTTMPVLVRLPEARIDAN